MFGYEFHDIQEMVPRMKIYKSRSSGWWYKTMVLQWVAESYGRLHHRNITRGNYIPYTRIHADRVPNAKIDDLDPAVPLTTTY